MKPILAFAGTWLKIHFRDPARVMIGFLLPLIVLAIFASVRAFPDAAGKLNFTVRLVGFFVIFNNVDIMTLVALREKGILRKLGTTPLSPAAFLAGHILARLVLSLLSMGLLLATATIWWQLSINDYLLSLTIVVILGSLVFITLGDAIVFVASSAETAFALTPIVLLPMLVFGEVFFKFQSGILWFVSQLMPSTYVMHALDRLANGASLDGLTVELAVLMAWIAVTGFVTARVFHWG